MQKRFWQSSDAACIALTACGKNVTDASTSETAETATSETASAVEYDLGLDDDGIFVM